MVQPINPNAYNFLRQIAFQFDRAVFPTMPMAELVNHPNEILLKKSMFEILPPEIVGEISTHVKSFSQMVSIMGLLATEVPKNSLASDVGASALLGRLGMGQSQCNATDRLLNHVFNTAFKSFSYEAKVALFAHMDACQSILSRQEIQSSMNRYSFRLRVKWISFQKTASRVLAHFLIGYIVQLPFFALMIYLCWKIVQLQDYIKKKIIDGSFFSSPRYLLLGMVAFVFLNPSNNLFFCQILRDITPNRYQYLVDRMQRVMWLPWNSITKYFDISMNFVLTKREALSRKFHTKSEEGSASLLATQTEKARLLWVHLFCNPQNLYG